MDNEKIYLVTITETSSRTVAIKANSREDAETKAEEAYNDGEIILDYDCSNEYDVSAREHTIENLGLYDFIK